MAGGGGRRSERELAKGVSAELYVFRNLAARRWWRALVGLERALDAGRQRSGSASRAGERAARRYAELVTALIAEGHASLPEAAAFALLEGEALLAPPAGEPPAGVRSAALLDLELIQQLLDEQWRDRAEARSGRDLPPLCDLAAEARPGGAGAFERAELERVARLVVEAEPQQLLDSLVERYRRAGTGVFARYIAFRWRRDELVGIARPANDRLDDLVGLGSQLERLTANVERFLDSRPALHTLLYGPRGSGKSTAVRGLLTRYAERGLRLVEVAPEELGSLPRLSERLARAPHRFAVYVDDLSFEIGDSGYQPLKTLLEGSLGERPENVLLIATSNRRHLVRESFAERPGLGSDDIHGWDTTNERLALADRFGLAITFPAADQRKYLAMVRELAGRRGVELDGRLDEAAIRFADWGNGYSGRTARQFVDTLV